MDEMKIQAFLSIILILSNLSKAVYAESKFYPSILVDGMIITEYEINQRAKFYKILNFPGNHEKQAKSALIDDRLKMRTAEKLGIKLRSDSLTSEMEVFASRANLNIDQFAERLERQGVDRSTWEAYMKVPILWFEAVNKKFASEIAKNINQDGNYTDLKTGAELQVLLTEIILPVQQGFEDEALNEAEKLSRIKSLKKFSEAAYKYSAAPTRNLGGKVDWQRLSDLPSVVKPLVAGLAIGEVTDPLPIPGGIAIFQLRDLRESRYKEVNTNFLDYIEFKFSKNSKFNKAIERDVIVCDDIYRFHKKAKGSKLIRNKTKIATISKSLKTKLELLDANEFSFENREDNITTLLMVCERSETEKLSTEEIKKINQSIANKRLFSLANSYIDNLRQEAVVVFK